MPAVEFCKQEVKEEEGSGLQLVHRSLAKSSLLILDPDWGRSQASLARYIGVVASARGVKKGGRTKSMLSGPDAKRATLRNRAGRARIRPGFKRLSDSRSAIARQRVSSLTSVTHERALCVYGRRCFRVIQQRHLCERGRRGGRGRGGGERGS